MTGDGSDGSLAARTTTDAAGIASAVVEDGGSVTVIESDARQLTTIVGAAAGDELSIGELSWKEPSRQLSISVPPGPGGSNHYYIWGNHLQAGYSTSPLATTASALVPTAAPVIATAYEVTPGDLWTMRGYLYDPVVALEAGGTPMLDGPWLPPLSFQLALTGVPSTVAQGAFETWRYAGGGPAYLFWSNSALQSWWWTVVLPPSASLASSYRFPTLPADLTDTWGNKTIFRSSVLAADTQATSYTEFRQDAGYEWPLHWMRAPTGPRKVRVSIGY